MIFSIVDGPSESQVDPMKRLAKNPSSPQLRFLRRLPALLLAAALALVPTACAATRPVTLEVTLPVPSYSLMMDSVPGLPITILAEDGAQVQETAAQGDLERWGADTGSKVMSQGSTVTFTSSGAARTFYWSPLLDGNGGTVSIPVSDALQVTVTATMAGRTTNVLHVLISKNEGFYTAKPG